MQFVVINQLNKQVKLVGKRINNIYMIDLDSIIRSLVSLNKDSWICHKRLAYISMNLIGKLSRKYLIVGLPKLDYINDVICDAYQKVK